jgi:branched-chain amino acid transport system permease protein
VSKFLQLTVSGLSLGAAYSLVALGFVVVLRSSRVLNLFHPGLVLLGGYLAYNGTATWGLPFGVALVAAVALTAACGTVVEIGVIAPLRSANISSTILATVGLLIAIEPIVDAVWGPTEQLSIGDPWGLRRVDVAGVALTVRDLWVIGLTAVVLVAIFWLFRSTVLGIAMRACAADPEAAAAAGIDRRLVSAAAWALGGALGGLAGVMAATAVGGGARLGLVGIAFAALPGLVLGGRESPGGAVIGSVAVGLAQQYTAGYAPLWLGGDFPALMPYILLLVVLLVRPSGLGRSLQLRAA